MFYVNLRQSLGKIVLVALFFVVVLYFRHILGLVLQFYFSVLVVDEVVYEVLSLHDGLLCVVCVAFSIKQIGHIVDGSVGRCGLALLFALLVFLFLLVFGYGVEELLYERYGSVAAFCLFLIVVLSLLLLLCSGLPPRD